MCRGEGLAGRPMGGGRLPLDMIQIRSIAHGDRVRAIGIRSRADPADRTYRCAPGRTIRPVLPGVARTASADPGCRIPVLGSPIGRGGYRKRLYLAPWPQRTIPTV